MMKCYFCNEVELKGEAEICKDCEKRGLKQGWLTQSTKKGDNVDIK